MNLGEARRALHDAGFRTVYVNHTDKWETHYNDGKDGWRVSYPHKRGEGAEKGIWVEAVVPSWPQEWFETGYCIVKTSQPIPAKDE